MKNKLLLLKATMSKLHFKLIAIEPILKTRPKLTK